MGFTGDPTAPVTRSGGAMSWNSYTPSAAQSAARAVEVPVLAEHQPHVAQAQHVHRQERALHTRDGVLHHQVVGGHRRDLVVMQPRRARPVKAGTGFPTVARLQKPCPPTRPDEDDVAALDRDTLCACGLVELGRRDRIADLAERLHAAQPDDVEQHPT